MLLSDKKYRVRFEKCKQVVRNGHVRRLRTTYVYAAY